MLGRFSNPEIWKLLIAQVPADFSDWLDFVAIGALLAFTWNEEPIVFAFLAVSLGLPYLVLGPFAGVLVDQTNTKTVLVVSNLGRGIATACFFFAPSWPVLMVLVFIRSSVDTFFTPAKQAAIQTLTRPDERARVNGLSHAINQSSKIVAPALGGSLLIWLEPQAIFVINAAVSLVAALLVLRLKNIKTALPDFQAKAESIFQEVRSGLREVREKLVLRSAILMMATGYFAMFLYDTLIAPLTRDLGFTQTHLGFALAAVGGGGVLGAVALSLGPDMRRPFLWIAAGCFMSAIVIGTVGILEMMDVQFGVTLFVALFAVAGLSTALAAVPYRTIIQNSVAPNRIGRVTALSEAVNTFALLLAPFIGVTIASLLSVGAAFVGGAIILFLVGLWAVVIRNRN